MELLLGLAFIGFAMIAQNSVLGVVLSIVAGFFLGTGIYNYITRQD